MTNLSFIACRKYISFSLAEHPGIIQTTQVKEVQIKIALHCLSIVLNGHYDLSLRFLCTLSTADSMPYGAKSIKNEEK